MRLPILRGVIRRRLLVNFRVDPDVMQKNLPDLFRPKLHNGFAIAGICLIRLESIRPRILPSLLGVTSENAAHRVAVEWTNPEGSLLEGVYIPRRDTGSHINAFAGGRLFPGEHHLADFSVRDDGERVAMSVKARDGKCGIQLSGRTSHSLPSTSCFATLEDSSAFFEKGKIGYSVTSDCFRLDGVELNVPSWQVKPFEIEEIQSSYFNDPTLFPPGSVAFDHALIMRDIQHEWRTVADMGSRY